MKKSNTSVFKTSLMFGLVLTASSVFAQDFCSATSHSGQSVKISSNSVGKIGQIGYELWDENGHGGDATFYEDGSMECHISGAKDYLCRAGLSLGSNKTYDQLDGDMIAEFKLVKSPAQNVGYSYIGVYGWMEKVPGAPSELVEYYVIDNTLANDMPGSWIGDTRMGTITVDGGTYTVYRNTRYGAAIKTSGNTSFYQYFSVRSSPRDCGTINISEHMRQWERMGLKMGLLYEAKVLGEAGNTGGEVRNGGMDFPHAKVYIGAANAPHSSTSSSDGGDAAVTTGGGDGGNAGGNNWGNFGWGNFDWGNFDWGSFGNFGNLGENPPGVAVISANVTASASKTFRVFNTSGRYLGSLELAPGASVRDALLAKFGQPGVYMMKSGSKTIPVKVSR